MLEMEKENKSTVAAAHEEFVLVAGVTYNWDLLILAGLSQSSMEAILGKLIHLHTSYGQS